MKVGINLINFGPTAEPERLKAWARLAEDEGYHSLLTSDHVAVTPDVQAMYPAPFYEPLSLLGFLAAATDRVEIGTTVTIVPYRHPLETARSFANIDRLSGGRLIFGVGVGWAAEEFAALGVPFGRRGALTDEYLGIIVSHWRHERISHDGTVTFTDVDTAPRPRRPPPIWVGGSSDAAMRRAARHGAWHPIRQRPSTFASTALPRLRAAAEAEGRPTPEICPRIQFHLGADPAPDDRIFGVGNLDQLRQDLALLKDLGCAHVILDSFNAAAQSATATLEFDRVADDYRRVAADVVDLATGSIR